MSKSGEPQSTELAQDITSVMSANAEDVSQESSLENSVLEETNQNGVISQTEEIREEHQTNVHGDKVEIRDKTDIEEDLKHMEESNVTSSSVKDEFLDNLLKQADIKKNKESDNGSGGSTDTEGSDSEDEEISDDSSSENESDYESASENIDSENPRGDDDDEEEDNKDEPVRSKNEIVDEPAEQLPENFTIGSDDLIEHIGELSSVIDKNIIVIGKISGEFRFLEEGSVLCLEDRTPIGYLFEIFGPVAKPLYRVKFDSDTQLEKFKEHKGEKVYYVVQKSKFAYTDTFKNIKGSDASNWNDEELPEEEQEFSDDEREMEAKKEKKKKRSRRGKNEDDEDDNSHQAMKRADNNKQATKGPIAGYHSRAQREQKSNGSQQRQYPQSQPQFQQFPVHPVPFQPPQQMVASMAYSQPPVPSIPQNQPFPFPLPPFPIPPNGATAPPQFIPPGVQPEQWMQMQQMFQMQQMMMAQQYFAQQNQGQFPPKGPQNPN